MVEEIAVSQMSVVTIGAFVRTNGANFKYNWNEMY